MQENSVVHFIPAKPPKQEKRVGIYARVSTNGSVAKNFNQPFICYNYTNFDF